MDFKLEPYTRKPFEVLAVQITETNMNDVADWCDGEIRNTADGTPFIKVKVERPAMTRQTRGFAGDWLLYAGKGFKVYTPKAFEASFQKKEK